MYGSIPTDDASIEAAKVYVSENASKFTEYSKEEFKKWKKYADDGNWTWRILGLIAGALIIFVHSLSFFGDLFGLSPFLCVMDIYLILFGACAIVLEYKDTFLPTKYIQLLHQEALFLYKPYGRAAFYIFVGVLLVVKGGILDFLVGLYTLIVGGIIFYGSSQAHAQLKELRQSVKSEAELEFKFREFDVDRSGFIDHSEFKKLCASLGRNMSDNEVETATFLLDRNNDGKLSLEEFKAWYELHG